MKTHDLFLASLDISNAFGSLLHWVLFEESLHTGAGEDFVQIIMNVYREALTTYNTTKGLSTPREAASGVRQGEPLNGAFFILAIKFILKKIQREDSDRDPGTSELFHFILAYADYMLLIARSAEDLQALLHLINVLGRKLGLKFNTYKCTTLHYSSKPLAGCRSAIFNLAGMDIPHLITTA